MAATPRCTSTPRRFTPGKATATLATWYVDDVEEVVDELRSRGVTYERYDDPSLVADESSAASRSAARSHSASVGTSASRR